jgi:hypothetical protein
MVANNVAIFDSDFRGEYVMQLYNYTSEVVYVPVFTRLVQLEFFPYLWGDSQFGSQIFPQIEMKVDEELYEKFAEIYVTERGI